MTGRVLAVRADSLGDVVLTGPAVRALARAHEVTMLCSTRGAPVARLLPGVERVLTYDLPWILADPEPVDVRTIRQLVRTIRRARFDVAVVFTSFHQSALPVALLLREAGVRHIGAISEDYPGSLLDVRHRVEEGVHEVERNLSLVRAMGYRSHDPAGDRLRIRRTGRPLPVEPPYVVVHPGASARARTWPLHRFAATARQLAERGVAVVVTGSQGERPLGTRIAQGVPGVRDLTGRTDLETMIEILRNAACLVVGNTGPAHLAAATGTPVASIFPPTVPAAHWRPWGVPHVLFGDQDVGCSGCRLRDCPIGQLCLRSVRVRDVVSAVRDLATTGRRRLVEVS